MDFNEFSQRAVTSLISKQADDGSWFNDAPATCAAVEALLEHHSGPERICRQSLLYRLSCRTEERMSAPASIPLSYAWQWKEDDISASNRGILSFGDLVKLGPPNPWISAKIARVLAVTDPDFWLGYRHLFWPLEDIKQAEPWLLAQIGLALLHFDDPYDSKPQDKIHIISYVEKVLTSLSGSHWESPSVTPQECTGIICSFLFHKCTEFLLQQTKSEKMLGQHRDSCATWLIESQEDSGAWASSFHVTSHCMRAVFALLTGGCLGRAMQERLRQSIKSAIRYLLSDGTLEEWICLSDYRRIETLATLLQVSRATILDPMFFRNFELDAPTLRPDVFLSYGGCDSEFAVKLAKDLEKCGINVWFAEWDIDYGDDIVQEIERGLDRTTKFIILLSPDALTRPWVRQELSAAFHRALAGPGKLIIPVVLNSCDPPAFLATKKRIDFTTSEPYAEKVKELARRLRKIRKKRE